MVGYQHGDHRPGPEESLVTQIDDGTARIAEHVAGLGGRFAVEVCVTGCAIGDSARPQPLSFASVTPRTYPGDRRFRGANMEASWGSVVQSPDAHDMGVSTPAWGARRGC